MSDMVMLGDELDLGVEAPSDVDEDVVVDDDDQASLYPSSPELRPEQLLLQHQGTLEDTLEDDDDIDVEDVVRRASLAAAAAASGDDDEVTTPVIDLYDQAANGDGRGAAGGRGGGGRSIAAGSEAMVEELLKLRDPRSAAAAAAAAAESDFSPFSESRFPSLFAKAVAAVTAEGNKADSVKDFSPSSLMREAIGDDDEDDVAAVVAAAAAAVVGDVAVSDETFVQSSGDDRASAIADLFSSPVAKEMANEFFSPTSVVSPTSPSVEAAAAVAAAQAAALSSSTANFRRSSLSAVAEAGSFERQSSGATRHSPPSIRSSPLVPNGGPTFHRRANSLQYDQQDPWEAAAAAAAAAASSSNKPSPHPRGRASFSHLFRTSKDSDSDAVAAEEGGGGNGGNGGGAFHHHPHGGSKLRLDCNGFRPSTGYSAPPASSAANRSSAAVGGGGGGGGRGYSVETEEEEEVFYGGGGRAMVGYDRLREDLDRRKFLRQEQEGLTSPTLARSHGYPPYGDGSGGGHPMESDPFLEAEDQAAAAAAEAAAAAAHRQQQVQQQQVQLAPPPSWETRVGNNLTDDQFNFRALSTSVDRLDLEMNPPTDRFNLIYLTLVLHGIGTLMPWNMFINANEYFVDYKLSPSYARGGAEGAANYATYFLHYVTFAAQVPNVIFNWINVFLNVSGNLTSRVVWTLFVEVVIFVVTIILAMIDSSTWPGIFFQITIFSVIVLNMVNGIYQNTVYGLAAKLPFRYTGAVVLGSNLSGTIVAVINLVSIWASPNPRTAAIYYFITALFVLLACFDTYFALPLNRFFRYHEHVYNAALQRKKDRSVVHAIPYCSVFKKCFPQCFNVFFTFFVTLTIFPAVHAEIHQAHPEFPIPPKYFSAITCFLTFNLCAVAGNLLPTWLRWPSPRWLFVPILLRFLLVPFFLVCNYKPVGAERLWPVFIHWDWVYWAGAATLGLSGGYFSSMAMMFCPRSVEPEYASTAGMFGAASIVTGIFAGIGFSYLMPVVVSHPALGFEAPDWWPQYNGSYA